jgi:hypothetical protein
VNGAELERASRENGQLKGRVEKHQLEIGALATENAKLSRELQDAYLTLERQAPIMDNIKKAQRGGSRAAEAASRYGFDLADAVEQSVLRKALLLAASVDMMIMLEPSKKEPATTPD